METSQQCDPAKVRRGSQPGAEEGGAARPDYKQSGYEVAQSSSLRSFRSSASWKLSSPPTLTNSITRKSSVVVSISSTSMMMLGCFTRRRIDTSFSIRCSCGTEHREGGDQKHRIPVYPALPPKPTGERSSHTQSTNLRPTKQLSLHRGTNPSLFSSRTKTGQWTLDCCSQKETDLTDIARKEDIPPWKQLCRAALQHETYHLHPSTPKGL